MPCGPRPSRRACVHSFLEVDHPRLSLPPVVCRNRTCVLLEDVQQDHQVPGSLVEHAIAGLREPNSQLTQLAIDV
jgi:hypothetical protein